MQVFKAALRIFFKHPVYIAVYIVWLGFMGVFIGMSSVDDTESTFAEERPYIAIIDRDRSELSEKLGAFLGDHGILVEVEDSRQAMQDATAQDRASYILIIPEGFGDRFIESAESGTAIPTVDTITSYESISANMMNVLVDKYLSTAHLYLSSETASSLPEALALTEADMENSADVTMLQRSQSGPVSPQWVLYMQFSGYTIMLSIIVSVGIVMGGFNRTDVRRRNLVAPIGSLSMNMQIAAACVVIMLLAWMWVCALGLVVFGSSLASIDPAIIGLALLALLAFCTVPLAIGHLLGQVATSELVINATGNIAGLIMSFLGGIWVSIDFMGEGISMIARFMPTYYYGTSLSKIIELRDFSLTSLAPVFGDMGIMLLFASAIFAIALVAGRLRVQSADAGGNAAAARTRT